MQVAVPAALPDETESNTAVQRAQSVDFRPGVHFSDKDSIKYLSVISSREPSPPGSLNPRATSTSWLGEQREDRRSLAKRFKTGLANLKDEHHKGSSQIGTQSKPSKPAEKRQKEKPDPAVVAAAMTQAMSGNGPWRPQKQSKSTVARTPPADINSSSQRTSSAVNRSTKRSSHPPTSSPSSANIASGGKPCLRQSTTLPLIQSLARSGHFEGSSTSSLTSISTKSKSSISDHTARSSVESGMDQTDQPPKKPIKSILKKSSFKQEQSQHKEPIPKGVDEDPLIVSYPQVHPPSPTPVSPHSSDHFLPIFTNNASPQHVNSLLPPSRPPRPPGDLSPSPLLTLAHVNTPDTPNASSPVSKRSLRAPKLTVINEVSSPTTETFPRTPPLSGPLSSSTVESLPPPETPPPARPLPRLPRRRSNSLPHSVRQSKHRRQNSAPINEETEPLQRAQQNPPLTQPFLARGPPGSPLRQSTIASPRKAPKMRQDALNALKNLDWSNYQTAIAGPTGDLLMSGDIEAPAPGLYRRRPRRPCGSNPRARTNANATAESCDEDEADLSDRDEVVGGRREGEEADEEDLLAYIQSFGFAHAGQQRQGEKQYRVGAAKCADEEYVRKLYWRELDEARARQPGEGKDAPRKVAASEEEGGRQAQDDDVLDRLVGSTESLLAPGRASPELGVLERDRRAAREKEQREKEEREEKVRRESGRAGGGKRRVSTRVRGRAEGEGDGDLRADAAIVAGPGARPNDAREGTRGPRSSAVVVMGCNLNDVGPTDWQNY